MARLQITPNTMSSPTYPPYPPQLSEEQLSTLIADIRDWQLTHGSLLRLPRPDFDKSVPIGVSVFPSLFSKTCFDEARNLQRIYNRLYAAVGSDEEWLQETVKEYAQ